MQIYDRVLLASRRVAFDFSDAVILRFLLFFPMLVRGVNKRFQR